MPEARDRLARPVDIAAIFARMRSGALGILADEADTSLETLGSPLRQQTTVTPIARRPTGFGATRGGGHGGGGSFGTPRSGNRRVRNLHGSPSAARENAPMGTARRGRTRTTTSVLPSWYPRTPLRDITAIVRV